MQHPTEFPEFDTQAAPAKPPGRGWGWRFSLLSLLIVAAVVCIVAALVGMRQREAAALREVEALRVQTNHQQEAISRLRRELGHLTIADPAKVHVIELPTRDDFHWKWRIYLPPGRRWKLLGGLGEVPANGFENVAHTLSTLDAGEFTLEALIERDRENDWRLVYGTPAGTTHFGIADSEFQRLNANGYDRRSIGSGALEVRQPGSPIEVMRLRTREEHVSPNGARSFRTSDEPQFGVLLWIEEARPGE